MTRDDAPTGGSMKPVEQLLDSPELVRAVENEEFKRFLDHIPVAVVVSRVRNEHSRIVYCNAAFEALSGRSSEDVLGEGWRVLAAFTDPEEPGRRLADAARSDEEFLGVFAREGESKKPVLVEAYASAIQHVDGSENYRIVALVDVSERDAVQREQLRQQVRDKDMLLKELQHRVKNNLQLVIALIRLEARQVREGGSVDLDSLARRVEALSLLYRALTPETTEKEIDLGHYLSEIAAAVMRSHGTEGIRLEINVENCPISVNVAMPAGLVVNELITNSFKHAFRERQEGTIAVSCLRSDDRYHVAVEDDGVGLPVGVTWPGQGKISDLMVRSLRENADTDLRIESTPGIGLRVTFTLQPKN